MVVTTDTLDWFNCLICCPWHLPPNRNYRSIRFIWKKYPTFKLWMTILNNALGACRGSFSILTMVMQLNAGMVSHTYKLYRVCGNIARIC